MGTPYKRELRKGFLSKGGGGSCSACAGVPRGHVCVRVCVCACRAWRACEVARACVGLAVAVGGADWYDFPNAILCVRVAPGCR